VAEKEATERRVYVLPQELVERVRKYQRDTLISSEVEAVRRLLDTALQLRDDTQSILDKFHNRFSSEKDLRVLSRDILGVHPLVDSIQHTNYSVIFSLKNGDKASFTISGEGKIWNKRTEKWEEDMNIPF